MLRPTSNRPAKGESHADQYATLALLSCVLGEAPAWAQTAPKMNYLGQVIDLTELIPPPPPRESEAWKQDLAEVLEMQQNRTDAQVRSAIADNVLSIYRFEDVLGPKYKKQNLPVTDAFFEKLHADQRAILIAAKNALQRPRPVVAHPKEVLALGGNPRLPTGYPSGAVVMTTLTAIVLSKMVPEQRFELSERNREFALNRVVIGQHFPRDIRAGEIAGTVIAYAMMEVPAFMRDLEPARTELRQVLGLPAEPVAAGPEKTR